MSGKQVQETTLKTMISLVVCGFYHGDSSDSTGTSENGVYTITGNTNTWKQAQLFSSTAPSWATSKTTALDYLEKVGLTRFRSMLKEIVDLEQCGLPCVRIEKLATIQKESMPNFN